jgi:ribosome-binding factor A
MMKPFQRSARVGGQIQRALSELLKTKIKDPRLEAAIITGVKMTRDLRIAKIYFTTLEGEKTKHNVTEGFNSSSGYIKRILAAKLGLRYMPDLKFFYDESVDYGTHIDNLLKKLDSAQKDEQDTKLH